MLPLLFVLSAATLSVSAGPSRPPNVVLILMDDMGWRDIGFMGNHFIETPNLDRLTQSGLVFTQAYASAPNCAPTRACLMSGQYAPRHGIYTVVDPRQPPGSPWHRLLAAESKSELDPKVVTLAESLRDGGYATGFFGMWNLGRGRVGPVTPAGQGFQTVVFPEDLGFAKDAYFNGEGHYLSDRLTDRTIEFVERNRERPFFAYLADHAVHSPFEPKSDLLEKYKRKGAASRDRRNDPAYAATVEGVDRNVGRIVETLHRLEISDNTVIIFTSDNGGLQQYASPLKGGKGELYEGGIRVPLVISCPSLKTPGARRDEPVFSIDLYPTLLELAGLNPPPGQPLDGASLVPLLQGAKTWNRSRLFWHFPCYVGRAAPSSAVREGDFKLIEFYENGGRVELYDLKNDSEEKRNLASALPEKTTELHRALQNWRRDLNAAPTRGPNPRYDPQARSLRGGGPQGQPSRKGEANPNRRQMKRNIGG